VGTDTGASGKAGSIGLDGQVPSGVASTLIVLTRDALRRGILAFLVLVRTSRRSPDS